MADDVRVSHVTANATRLQASLGAILYSIVGQLQRDIVSNAVEITPESWVRSIVCYHQCQQP